MFHKENPWREADQSPEDPDEVALIVKAKLHSDSRQRQISPEQQAFCLFNTHAQKAARYYLLIL